MRVSVGFADISFDMVSRLLLLWWYVVIAFASIANPLVAIFQLYQGDLVGGAFFGAFTAVSWLVVRNVLRDVRFKRGS